MKNNSNINENICINENEIEETETFVYLRANISTEWGTDKDIDVRIKKSAICLQNAA